MQGGRRRAAETNAHVTNVAAVEASDTFRKRRVFHAVQQVEGEERLSDGCTFRINRCSGFILEGPHTCALKTMSDSIF